MAYLSNVTIKNSNGGIKASGGHVGMNNVRFENCNTGLTASDGSLITGNNVAKNTTDTAFDITDSFLYGRQMAGIGSTNHGLVLDEGSRGYLVDSKLKNNSGYDLRYGDDILYSLFDTDFETAQDLKRGRVNPDLGEEPILNTTPEQLWAEEKEAQAKKVSGFLGSVAVGNFLNGLF